MKHPGWMICYKLWLETRARFGIAFGLNIVACLAYVMLYGHFYPIYLKGHPHAASYQQYAYMTIFKGWSRGTFQFTGLLLGLSGWQRERSRGALGFSLALPMSRLRQLMDRALFEAAQMVFIAFASLLVTWALSNMLGHVLPLGVTLLFATLWTVVGLQVFALTFLLSIIIPGEYTTVGAAYVAYMAYAVVVQSFLRSYPVDANALVVGALGNVIDRHTLLWTGNVPVAMIAWFLAASAILVGAGIAVGVRQEL